MRHTKTNIQSYLIGICVAAWTVSVPALSGDTAATSDPAKLRAEIRRLEKLVAEQAAEIARLKAHVPPATQPNEKNKRFEDADRKAAIEKYEMYSQGTKDNVLHSPSIGKCNMPWRNTIRVVRVLNATTAMIEYDAVWVDQYMVESQWKRVPGYPAHSRLKAYSLLLTVDNTSSWKEGKEVVVKGPIWIKALVVVDGESCFSAEILNIKP